MHEQFESLLQGFLEERLSVNELQAFLQLVREDKHQEALQQAIAAALQQKRFAGLGEADRADILFNRVMQAAARQQSTAAVVPVNTRRYRFVAAAAIVLLIAGAAWYLLQSRQPATTTITKNQPIPTDVLPGGDKATLTLADGRVIVLDSAKNGTLAQQSGVKITKVNGRLTYVFDRQAAGNTYEGPVAMNTITTPRGGQYQLILPDGSKVWLNAASSLRFPAVFKGGERKVTLQGEGYFEVVKATTGTQKLPFTVEANGMAIKVLGTHFNVMAYDDEKQLATTLLEGAVQVDYQGHTARLQPGLQALVETTTGSVNTAKANTEEVTAWKDGYFFFEKADVQAIMRQVARWYDVDIEYRNLPLKKFSGTLPRSVNLSQLCKMLEFTGNAHFIIEGNKIIVNR